MYKKATERLFYEQFAKISRRSRNATLIITFFYETSVAKQRISAVPEFWLVVLLMCLFFTLGFVFFASRSSFYLQREFRSFNGRSKTSRFVHSAKAHLCIAPQCCAQRYIVGYLQYCFLNEM